MNSPGTRMDYSGPLSADYDNVRALNLDFLRVIRRHPEVFASAVPGDGPAELATLSQGRAASLATAPFLLFSLRERDAGYWDEILDAAPTRDIFDAGGSQAIAARLIAAATGFLWGLCKRNPYAARLICGASLHWSEQIAELTLCDLLARVESKSDLLVLRCGSEKRFWRKLICDGTSTAKRVRRAAHLGALQQILTCPDTAATSSWRMAASRSAAPGLRLAEPRD